MAKLVSKTYGEALFELAVEEGKEDALLEEVSAIKKVLDENPDFSKIMDHPKILKEDKLETLENVFKGRISEDLLGFLHLIVLKDRYSEIDSILEYFIEEIKNLKGIGKAVVTTAVILDDDAKTKVYDKLVETTKYNSMEIEYEVDETIIGGMIIRIGDRVVDSSIQTKLNKLQRELLQIQV